MPYTDIVALLAFALPTLVAEIARNTRSDRPGIISVSGTFLARSTRTVPCRSHSA